MARLSDAVLLGLALGGLGLHCHSARVMNHKVKATSVENLETVASSFFKCCKIVEGTIHDSEKDTLYAIRNKKCKLRVYSGTYWGPVPGPTARQCETGKYPHSDPYLDFLKVETLGSRECETSPWCRFMTEPKCYKITQGELSPWYNHGDDVFPQLPRKDFPSGMAISVSGKICSRSDSRALPRTYLYGPLFAKLKILAMEEVGKDKCNGNEWKQECANECHGLEAAPECDDFRFWKDVLTTEGIKAPNWENTIAAAQSSNPEGLAWGKITPDEAAKDTLWNARRDTVLKTDDLASSWS